MGNFLLRGRALLHIRLYCFSIDLQGRNYHFDIFFLRHSWILWIRSICYYPLLFDFILPLKCQGVWDGRRAGLVWCGVNVQTADLQPLSEAAEHGDGFYDMKRQCHLPPSEFCGKGQWRCHKSAVQWILWKRPLLYKFFTYVWSQIILTL